MDRLFFSVSDWVLAAILFALVGGSTAIGLLAGRSLREQSEHVREPFSVLQAALLALVALILAFGLSLAVSRYEARRSAVVDEANTIGTTYLRAQTLREPMRTTSLGLLRRYTDTSIRLSSTVPDSVAAGAVVAAGAPLQRMLWRAAGRALDDSPQASAPRLYVESLNEMIDMQTVRVSALSNRVPFAVLILEVVGACVALLLLSLYLGVLARGVVTVLLAAALVTLLLLVTFDLDRPTRGLIRIPTTPLTALRSSMTLPPAATGPNTP